MDTEGSTNESSDSKEETSNMVESSAPEWTEASSRSPSWHSAKRSSDTELDVPRKKKLKTKCTQSAPPKLGKMGQLARKLRWPRRKPVDEEEPSTSAADPPAPTISPWKEPSRFKRMLRNTELLWTSSELSKTGSSQSEFKAPKFLRRTIGRREDEFHMPRCLRRILPYQTPVKKPGRKMSVENFSFTNSSSCSLRAKVKQPEETGPEDFSEFKQVRGIYNCGITLQNWKPEVDEMMTLKYHMSIKSRAINNGRFFLGYRKEDSLPVIIKQLRTNFITFIQQEEDNVAKMMPFEVAVLKRLDTESTCTQRVVEWYTAGQETYIVIERPANNTVPLLEYIRNHLSVPELNEEKCKRIFRQLLDTALEMESKGIFHRDITSANVVVVDITKSKVQLRNFERTALFEPGDMFTGQLGSEESSSPESLRKQPYSPSAATVWQLGVLLYTMKFNRRPLISKKTIISDRKVPIRTIATQECRNLLRRCLEKDPEDRISLWDIKNHPWLLD